MREELRRSVEERARSHAEDLILDALLPGLARSEPEPEAYRADEIEAAFRDEAPADAPVRSTVSATTTSTWREKKCYSQQRQSLTSINS